MTKTVAQAVWRIKPTFQDRFVTVTYKDGRPAISSTAVRSEDDVAKALEHARTTGTVVTAEWDVSAHIEATNDPYYSSLWGLKAVKAEDAWARTTGTSVTVAVVDTGVRANPDLGSNILPGKTFSMGAVTDGADDGNGHGTHVSGTIAAMANNAVGVAGIAPGVKLLPVKALDNSGSGSMSDVAAGIVYAVDAGAKVVNLSLGASSSSTAMSDALEYARVRDVLVVAAAGNGGAGAAPSWPAADDRTLAVTAVDSSLNIASFSQRGSYIDVAAPGVSIISTSNQSGYVTYSGTSMATPHVVAVAALLRSANPSASAVTIRTALESGAYHLGDAGKNTTFGAGLVVAPSALAALDTLSAPPSTSAPTTAPPTTKAPTTAPPTTKAPTTAPPTTKAPTPAPPTTQLPTKPAKPNMVMAGVSLSDIVVGSSASATPSVKYRFERDGQLVWLSPYPTFIDVGRAAIPGTYTYAVRVVNAAGAMSDPTTASITVTAPAKPSISFTRPSPTSAKFSTDAQTPMWGLYMGDTLVGVYRAGQTSVSVPFTGSLTYKIRGFSPTGASAFSDSASATSRSVSHFFRLGH